MNSMKLRRALVFQIIVACCLFWTATALAAEDGVIVDRKGYDFPSYEQAVKDTDVERYADKAAYEAAVSDTQFEFQKLTYLSDGLKVTAYLYAPKQIKDRKFPTIIFNRGSVVRGNIAPELIAFFHRLASAGFVILAPMLRQSDGGEGKDEVGGADVNDLMNLVPVARTLGFVDMNNLFMYGESRGGMMTYQAIKKAFPINAAAVFGGFTDMQELIASHPKQYPQAALKQIWPDYETRKQEIWSDRSASAWPDRLTVPVLIMHGGSDPAVNTQQSLGLAQQLQKLGRVYQLIIYAGDNHSLSNNQDERDRQAISWFKKYLRK